MGKLTNVKSTMSVVVSRLGRVTDDHGHSDAIEPWRRWYKTGRWQRLRWMVLERDMFTCFRCGKATAETSRLVAHHVRPHRGDPTLFWDTDNIKCACKECHDGPIARDEAAAMARGEV